jgi:hypothetical protein
MENVINENRYNKIILCVLLSILFIGIIIDLYCYFYSYYNEKSK